MDTWEAIGVVVAGLAGVGGLVTGFLGQRRARQSNKLAERANDIAARAISEAEESNRIAQKANDLSEHANQVVTLQAAQQVEQWLVEWRVKWDGDAALAIENYGRDTARHVYVIIEGDDINKRDDRYLDIESDGTLTITFPQFPEKRSTEVARRTDEWNRNVSSGYFGRYQKYIVEVVVTVHWLTGLGQPRQQVFNLTLE